MAAPGPPPQARPRRGFIPAIDPLHRISALVDCIGHRHDVPHPVGVKCSAGDGRMKTSIQDKTRRFGPRPSPKIPVALRLFWRAALLTFPLLVLRALFRPRDRRLADLTDHQLHDIGLTRGDVDRPQERTLSAELEMYRLLRSRDWR